MHNPPATVEQLQLTEHSGINQLNIVNHFCMVTIIGQIKPWGCLKTRTTCFSQHWKRVQSSSWGQIELGDIQVSRETICNIAKESVNNSSSACGHIHQSGYTHQQKVEKVFWAFGAFWRFLKVKFAFSQFCRVQLYKSYSAILHPHYDGIFKLGIVFQNRYSLVGYIS